MTPLEITLVVVVLTGVYVTWCIYYGLTSTEFGTWQRTASKPGLALFTVIVVWPVIWVKTENSLSDIIRGDAHDAQ